MSQSAQSSMFQGSKLRLWIEEESQHYSKCPLHLQYSVQSTSFLLHWQRPLQAFMHPRATKQSSGIDVMRFSGHKVEFISLDL